MFSFRRLRSSLLLGAMLGLACGFFSAVPQADAAICRTNFVYVDSSAGVDRAGCWGNSSADAYATISAALADRNANYSGTEITIYFKGNTNQTLDNTGSANNVYLRPQTLGAATSAVFTVKGSNYIRVENFTFSGSGGVKMNGTAKNVTVKNNTFSTATSFVEITGNNVVNIENNTFQSAYIYDHSNSGRVSIWTNTFSGSASKSGYHVYVTSQTSGGIDFVGNKLTSTGGNALYMADAGGAIIMSNTLTGPGSVSNTAATLTNTTGNIQNNTVSGYGKGFTATGTGTTNINYVDKNTITLTDGSATNESIGFGFSSMSISHFTNNVVTLPQGTGDYGLKVSKTNVTEALTNSFSNLNFGIYADNTSFLITTGSNTFTTVGTGIWLVQSYFTTIEKNTIGASSYGILLEAVKGTFSTWNSEGASNDPGASIVTRDSVIQNNAITGSKVGLGMASYQVYTVKNNTFSTVSDGVDQYYSYIYTFTGNVLNHDTAKAGGKGAYLYASTFGTVDRNSFNAFENGIKLVQTSLLNTSFNGNGIYGGVYGLYLDNATVTPLMTNNLFSSMTKPVYLNTGSTGFSLVHNTFYGNTTAVTLNANLPAGNTITLANNVFAGIGAYTLNVQDTADIGTLNYNLYDHAKGATVVNTPTGALNVDALRTLGFESTAYEETNILVNPGAGDFHLINTSRAVNSADNSYGVNRDFDRHTRPVCVTSDRGAFELMPTGLGALNDADGDGLCRFQESAWGLSDSSTDYDGDGLTDTEEIYEYLTEPNVSDTDGDTYSDGEEILTYHTDPLDAADHADDNDRDGMDDAWETHYGLDPSDASDAGEDLDGDGLTNAEEYAAGYDPSDADMDNDDAEDGAEVTAGTDPNNTDSDGDGMEDGFEITYGLDPLSDDAANDSDSDGLTNYEEFDLGTSPVDEDTDGDGMDDAWEEDHSLNPIRSDGNSDYDRDGLSNLEEYTLGTSPDDDDSDGDGYEDGVEVNYSTDPLDSTDYPSIIDDDGDGMDDSWEATYSCVNETVSDASSDPDGDGLSNLEEYTFSSDPCDSDTDSDGMPDDYEASYGLDLSNNDASSDEDSDGLTNSQEYSMGTSPVDDDTDGDGFGDGAENTAGTDPLDASDFPPDGDMDGLDDDWEASYSCMDATVNDAATDDDGDGYTAAQEYSYGTNPCSSDTDGDGLPDSWELTYGLNATVSSASTDSDSDGLTDSQEYSLGTLPNDSDTDGDGMPDGYEDSYGLDPLLNDASSDLDSDWLTNFEEYSLGTSPADSDTDSDGLPDDYEVAYGLNPTSDDSSDDLDGDGLDNARECLLGTTPNVSDTDGDGYSDGVEVDAGNDPLDATDYPLIVDSDSDGLPDTWESSYSCMDAAVSDATTDDDSDLLTASQEYTEGTDPCSNDTDGDLFTDAYEVTEGSDATLSTSTPALTISVVGYGTLIGSGDGSSWDATLAYTYGSPYSFDLYAGDTQYLETYFNSADKGAFAIQWDEDDYLGSVGVLSCGGRTYAFDPSTASCTAISDYTSVSSPDAETTHATLSSQLSMWPDLAGFYTFSDWDWYRSYAISSGTAYDSFSVTLGS